MRKRILFSFVNWMKYSETIECIKHLINLSIDNSSVSVVDNGSTNDSYQKLLDEDLPINLIRSIDNIGYAAGHQLNVNYALQNGYDYVVILNSDIELFSNTISKLIDTANTFPNAIIAPTPVKKNDSSEIVFAHHSQFYIDKIGNKNTFQSFIDKSIFDIIKMEKYFKVSDVSGAAFMIPTSIILKHGFMKPDFFLYCEELDYFFRLRGKGVDIILSTESYYIHRSKTSTTISNNIRSIVKYYQSRNYIRFCLEHEIISKEKIWKDKGGRSGLLANVVKHWLLNLFKKDSNLLYFEKLGFYHGLTEKKGKVFDPNKFI